MRAACREESVSILRVQNARLSKNEKSSVLDRIQGALARTAVAKQMRPLFGPCGSAVRRHVLVAVHVELSPEEKNVRAAWLAYRKAKKTENFARKEESDGKKRQ